MSKVLDLELYPWRKNPGTRENNLSSSTLATGTSRTSKLETIYGPSTGVFAVSLLENPGMANFRPIKTVSSVQTIVHISAVNRSINANSTSTRSKNLSHTTSGYPMRCAGPVWRNEPATTAAQQQKQPWPWTHSDRGRRPDSAEVRPRDPNFTGLTLTISAEVRPRDPNFARLTLTNKRRRFKSTRVVQLVVVRTAIASVFFRHVRVIGFRV